MAEGVGSPSAVLFKASNFFSKPHRILFHDFCMPLANNSKVERGLNSQQLFNIKETSSLNASMEY